LDRKSNGKKKDRRAVLVGRQPLNPGDVICPKCRGSGWLTGKNDWEYTCNKCWGAGKLDWIERIMGKPSPHHTLKGNWTIEVEDDLKALYDCDMEKEIIDAMSQELAKKVDEEIIGKMISLSITKSKLR
jgi:hypothetical protein